VATDRSDEALQALIKLEVACRLALESLAALPERAGHALRDPIKELCRLTELELERLQPGFTRDDPVA
jgi:hypothetical protein